MMNILDNKRNDLMKRNEISAVKEESKTPTMEEVQSEISALLKKDASLVAVKDIKGGFGVRKFTVKVNVYDSEEMKNRIEPKPKKKGENKEAAEGAK